MLEYLGIGVKLLLNIKTINSSLCSEYEILIDLN